MPRHEQKVSHRPTEKHHSVEEVIVKNRFLQWVGYLESTGFSYQLAVHLDHTMSHARQSTMSDMMAVKDNPSGADLDLEKTRRQVDRPVDRPGA
jgi:hypothetical protein